jgi:pimeloyl-ACP methyl ester carboxylesterase
MTVRVRALLIPVVVAGVLLVSACGSDAPQAAIEPGGLARGVLTIDGATIEYVTITPAGFVAGSTAPVLLALPPGGQDIGLTEAVSGQIYQAEALARGWVVVSPAAPAGGPLWYSGAQEFAAPLMDWVESWVQPEGGSFHVAGVSNGGLRAFRVAIQQEQRVQSLLAYPGAITADDIDALQGLADTPVRLFVGGDDSGWIPGSEDARDRLLDLGGDVTLTVFPGEGHRIDSLGDGVRIFDDLDATRGERERGGGD